MKLNKKKAVIVTGGSSGIGKSISYFLSSRGYLVLNLDIKKNFHKKIKFVKCDLSKIEQIQNKSKLFENITMNIRLNEVSDHTLSTTVLYDKY